MPDAVVEEQVRLVPSPDTIEAYESRAKKMRLGAYLSTGLAAAGVGAFAIFQARAGALYGSSDAEGTFLAHRAALLRGIDATDGVDHRSEAERLQHEIRTAETISFVGAAVGGIAAAAATYFWVAGDPPGRYARFRLMATPQGVRGEF